ncbi:MAG: hypothetical protein KKH34_07290, partial [Candidatus Omnitrophica bacterium]|nr:hypothetical protein [Candidatus Omnitrophota bacterium]
KNGGYGDIALKEFSTIITKSFEQNAVIQLEGCYTAFGNNSIAHEFKNILPDAHVFGYTGPAKPWFFLIDETWPEFWNGSEWIEIREEGCLK